MHHFILHFIYPSIVPSKTDGRHHHCRLIKQKLAQKMGKIHKLKYEKNWLFLAEYERFIHSRFSHAKKYFVKF